MRAVGDDRRPTRLAAAIVGVLLACTLPATGAYAFAISKWEAGTCRESGCADAGPSSAFYTQAAGHPDFGITDFAFASREAGVVKERREPEGHVKDVRVDLPPGLVVNPEATSQQCTEEQLDSDSKACPAESQVGEDEATGTAEIALGIKETVTEHFPVYNMGRKPGQPCALRGRNQQPDALAAPACRGTSTWKAGSAGRVKLKPVKTAASPAATTTSTSRSRNIPQQPEIVESRLIFWGVPQSHTGIGTPTAFITLPSTCSSRPITHLHVDSYEDPGHFLPQDNETPRRRHRLQPARLQPRAVAERRHQPGRRAGRRERRPAHPAAHHAAVQAELADVQSAEVALPEGTDARTHPPPTGSSRAAMNSSPPPAARAHRSSGTSRQRPRHPATGRSSAAIFAGAPEPGQGPESGGKYRIFLIAQRPRTASGCAWKVASEPTRRADA